MIIFSKWKYVQRENKLIPIDQHFSFAIYIVNDIIVYVIMRARVFFFILKMYHE